MDKVERIQEIEDELESIAREIEDLESNRSNLEDELRALEKEITPEDTEALLSEKRMAAWRRQVRYVRKQSPEQLPPSQWWVPLAPDYLGGGEPSNYGIGPRITLCIRPDGRK